MLHKWQLLQSTNVCSHTLGSLTDIHCAPDNAKSFTGSMLPAIKRTLCYSLSRRKHCLPSLACQGVKPFSANMDTEELLGRQRKEGYTHIISVPKDHGLGT